MSETSAAVEDNFPPQAESVARARRFVSRTLAEWDADRFELSAVAITSELATNAVLHAHTAFTVRLTLAEEKLRVEVRDGSAHAPRSRHYGPDATTGRGLALVEALAAGWGTHPDRVGKVVWAVLDGAADEPDLSNLFADDLAELGPVELPSPATCNVPQASLAA